MTNAAQFFDARPAPGGGVTLSLRTKFRDQWATELNDEGVAVTREVRDQENGDSPTEQTLFVFGPLLPGQSTKLVELSNGTMALMLVSPADELIGDNVTSNSGTVSANNAFTDRRSAYRTGTLGGEARKLADINAINKAPL